ncbi:peptidyl-prolyl cis-trans isomerase FKBP43-like [Raphanus sativus]|uniref:peptidylprolyl isomerase n=1 Tax=Raphanus sativus TaxID=3726 RepID=A0A6J0MBX1_RAPSA|nr:peptidyl-prolyl cis-trans isomerase FKBP43-like [Raphanus sativus]
MEETTNDISPNGKTSRLINAYAAQCAKCNNWRFIQSQEEYTNIRSESVNKSFECNNCEEPEVDVLCNWSSISCLLRGSYPFILKRDIRSSRDVLPIQNGDGTLSTKKRKGVMREETTEMKKHPNGRNMEKDYGTKKLIEPVIIKEIENVKLDGKVAVLNRKVSIYYTGRLKASGKLFDSNLGDAPLRFRLGGEKVIKGLSIGIEGMRVGDKRRLIIPPSLGYSEEGLMESVPKNAWLVYEVEAVRVR